MGRRAFVPTPFEKTAWLENVCGKRADGSEFLYLLLPAQFRHRFRKGGGESQDVGCRTQYREAAPQKHYTCRLAPKWDSQEKAALRPNLTKENPRKCDHLGKKKNIFFGPPGGVGGGVVWCGRAKFPRAPVSSSRNNSQASHTGHHKIGAMVVTLHGTTHTACKDEFRRNL